MIDAAPPVTEVAALGRASARAGVGLHQLRYILAAAEHGGFRRAARYLGVQQSAVSRRIHELETRLGAQIFERGPHGVTLTSAGRDFVRGAQGAVSELDLAVDRAAQCGLGEQRLLRIGVQGGFNGGVLGALLQQLLERDPQLRIDLVEAEAAVLSAALAHGRLDVGFLLDEPSSLAAQSAWRERLLVAIPAGDPLASASSLLWSDLAHRRLMAPACLASVVSDLAGRRLAQDTADLVIQNAGPPSTVRLVALGQGYALVSEHQASRVTGVVYRPLARTFLLFKAVLGRRPEKPALRRLLGLLSDV